jgi:PAS domain S-box-containing protein
MTRLGMKIAVVLFITGLILTGMVGIAHSKSIHPAFILLLSLPVSGMAAFVLIRMIVLPLRNLREGMDIIQAGHLNVKVGLPNRDEIGRLSRAVDRLIESLQKSHEMLFKCEQENAGLKMAGGELRDRESYFRRLFENANDAVFIYDFDGRLFDVNQKACMMLGYAKKELLGLSFFDLYVEPQLTRSQAAFKAGRETTSVRYESTFRRKDGTLIDVELSSGAVDLKRGIMQSIISNITERKEMERSLRDSEERFRTFMETASDLMFITDANGDLSYVNEAMANRLGYMKAELIGQPLQDLFDKESLDEAKEMRQHLLSEGENLHRLIWETKSRKRIYGEMKAVGQFDETGRFQGIRGIFRDITERKKIETAQRLAQMGKMAADIAHEVKNQLAALTMRAQICLLRPSISGELRQDIKIILEQGNHIDDVVKRLLKFSRPSQGQFSETNIHDTIIQILKLVEKQYATYNVSIVKRFAASLPSVRCDEKQIQEVLLNLLGNSFEAMPKGGQITITTSLIEDMIHIEVTDTGMGIRESDLEHIFDPFFTTKEEGTGLGLSVCYGIMQAHRGDLIFESEFGKGTTAKILLPVR